MTVTNQYSLVVDALDQCTCLINIVFAQQEKFACAATKIRNINWLLQHLGSLYKLRCQSHDKRQCRAFETLIGTVACICASMCTPIRLFLLLAPFNS